MIREIRITSALNVFSAWDDAIASRLAPTSEAARDKASWSVKTPHLSAVLVDTTGNIFEAGTNSIASADLVMSVSPPKVLRLYSYDALDRLTGVGLLEATMEQRFYQKDHLATEVGLRMRRTILRHQAQPLAQNRREVSLTETTLLATDQAHSLLKTLSSNNPQQLSYTAYGHHPPVSGSSALIGFNGECPDATTGHYPLGQGNRFFNPVLMRFNSPDELSPFGQGGINPYAFCGGDPINYYDPTGNVRFFRPWESAAVIVKKPLHKIKPTSTTISRAHVASGSLSTHPINGISNLPSDQSPPISTAQPFPHTLETTQPANKTTNIYPRRTTYTDKLNKHEIEYHELVKNPDFQTTSTEALRTQWEELTRKLNSNPRLNRSLRQKQLKKLELKIKKFSVEQHKLNHQIRN
ncbi:RHS repeat-associated core domain-containing protein [Pseudomonas umsongensis]|uniref:RHS repeat-associated core domain-containing protein n=1 Tax=Pseudomonas umsongensis TaxID=198618 RepID=UPI003ED05822